MKIISINAGSSSLKFSLFNMDDEAVIASGLFERIGIEGSNYTIKFNGEKITQEVELATHVDAVNILLDKLTDLNIISSLDEINGVGHRIVQGKDIFTESVVVNDDVMEKLEAIKGFAPLHNPANMLGIEAFRKVLPNVPMVAVFDTAFHQTMGPESYLFPVPYEWYENYKIRRYGAHGTSHQYVSQRCAQLMNKDVKDLNIITCHLGNGASITAVKNGKCINTSMGLTPLGGIMMGTRSGDLDPTVVFYMMKKLNCTPDEMDTYLNKKSGMLGVSGISSDARDVEAACENGNERAIITQELYVNRVINVIGGYVMQMGGVDAIAFTAGVGENDIKLRAKILKALTPGLGLDIDYEANNVRAKEACVSTADSKVSVWIVPTNEEVVIARDTVRILGL